MRSTGIGALSTSIAAPKGSGAGGGKTFSAAACSRLFRRSPARNLTPLIFVQWNWGHGFEFETISTVTKLPVELNLQPTVWGLAVYFRDITERRRIESDLRARDAILTLAERTAGVGVWDLDLETNIVNGTAQFFRIMGLPPETGVASIETIRKLRHPEDGERAPSRLRGGT